MDCQLETMMKCKHNNRTFQSKQTFSFFKYVIVMHPNTMLFPAHTHGYCQSFKNRSVFISGFHVCPLSRFMEARKKHDLNIYLSAVKCSANVELIQLLVEKFIIIFAFVMLSIRLSAVGIRDQNQNSTSTTHIHTHHTLAATRISDFSSLLFFLYPYVLFIDFGSNVNAVKGRSMFTIQSLERCLI